MNATDARRLTLDLPGTIEKSHFGKPDFRIRNRIFMSLPDEGRAVIKLMPEQQEMLTDAEPEIFAPVPGGWGRRGWTTILLGKADEAALKSALTMAWRNVAPASLRKAFDAGQPESRSFSLFGPAPWSS